MESSISVGEPQLLTTQVRMALDRRNYRQLVDTTVEIANKVTFLEMMNSQLQTI